MHCNVSACSSLRVTVLRVAGCACDSIPGVCGSVGNVNIETANGGIAGISGNIKMQTGSTAAGKSGELTLKTGNAVGGSGGDITLNGVIIVAVHNKKIAFEGPI